MRACQPKTHKEKRGPQPFGSSLYMLFLLPLGPPYVNQATQECCLFYRRSLLQSLDLPLFYFAGFSLPCLLATTILDSFSCSNYLTRLRAKETVYKTLYST